MILYPEFHFYKDSDPSWLHNYRIGFNTNFALFDYGDTVSVYVKAQENTWLKL